jgi:Fe-S-cluster containining protein
VSASKSRQAFVDAVGSLHGRIDAEVARLERIHEERLQCRRGCDACCLDDLTVTEIEAERIRARHSEWLEVADPHSPGACAFLDEAGACRIYAERPSVCRSQGLPLRILFEDADDEIAEHRDICPLNVDGGPALVDLREEDCWLIGPFEHELASLDRRFAEETGRNDADAEPRRIALRSLFAKTS